MTDISAVDQVCACVCIVVVVVVCVCLCLWLITKECLNYREKKNMSSSSSVREYLRPNPSLSIKHYSVMCSFKLFMCDIFIIQA